MLEEAVQQYKDYYETDQEDLEDFQYMNDEDRLTFAKIYKDYSKTAEDSVVMQLVEVKEGDGLLSGVTDALRHLLPKVKAEAARASVQ